MQPKAGEYWSIIPLTRHCAAACAGTRVVREEILSGVMLHRTDYGEERLSLKQAYAGYVLMVGEYARF